MDPFVSSDLSSMPLHHIFNYSLDISTWLFKCSKNGKKILHPNVQLPTRTCHPVHGVLQSHMWALIHCVNLRSSKLLSHHIACPWSGPGIPVCLPGSHSIGYFRFPVFPSSCVTWSQQLYPLHWPVPILSSKTYVVPYFDHSRCPSGPS